MPRLSLWLFFACLLTAIAACSSSPAPQENGIRPTQTQRYDTQKAVRPTAPAPIEGNFREDDPVRVVLNNGQRPLLLFIYTESCGNCLAVRPLIAALEADFWGEVDVLYLNRDNLLNYEIFTTYDILSQPEFLLLNRKNQTVEHWRGAPTLEDLRASMELVLDAQ